MVACTANNNLTSQPETTQGEQIPAETPEMNGDKTSDLPEMTGQPPQMSGEKPSGYPDMIDFDAMVKNGVISQETCNKIKAYMEEHKPANLPEMDSQAPEMNGQSPQMNEQLPQMNGEAPSNPSEMTGERPANGGLLNDLLKNGIITQTEYDALSEAVAK